MPKRLSLALVCAATLACSGPAPAFQQLERLSTFTWNNADDPNFGGFSALEISDDGLSFVAVSDRAGFVEGTLERSGGKIVGVTAGHVRPLLSPEGIPLRDQQSDSEGLAIAADGTAYLSFEAENRISKLSLATGITEAIVRPPVFYDLQLNSGLEALALDPQGRPITIPERSGKLERPFPVYRLDGTTWSTPYSVRRDGPYLIVGADTGPDNRLYVLERDFSGIFGFSSRVRSFAFGDDSLNDERLLMQSRTGQFDNLEGISVWRDEDDEIRVTMISDDNQIILQRTEFVEFRVPRGDSR
ncbi:esterase-like activity of phytase family protein [Pseudoruegeria sp. SK021]|uniref:esterase-like activity of phytase family protein n=1 Tax=Pseudoruegeria sp. SK021 TaxID=1933035 RepID=UPI000A253692|nr:esterase-like activity of phytase family protein [Pseudoruegeria sp. SK021]OSP55374.1 hypothetical protein BV911_08040 [Pseudoruegeria sp. SK021]